MPAAGSAVLVSLAAWVSCRARTVANRAARRADALHGWGAAGASRPRALAGTAGGGSGVGSGGPDEPPEREAPAVATVRDEDEDGGKRVPPRPITKDDVELSYARSSGPGGQNVNKVNTKADMRLCLRDAAWLPRWVARKLREQQKNRINSEDELVVTSDRHRTQPQNVDDALEKLQAMIDKASYIAPPQTAESKAKLRSLKRRANENRLRDKKAASARKDGRGGGGGGGKRGGYDD